jgi:PilZ domain
MPVKYRPTGATAWQDGRTENISRSGVLFRTEQPISLRTRIEFLIALPEEVGGRSSAVLCLGRVVRTEPPKPDDPRPAIAATIAGYRAPVSSNHATDPQSTDPRRI